MGIFPLQFLRNAHLLQGWPAPEFSMADADRGCLRAENDSASLKPAKN